MAKLLSIAAMCLLLAAVAGAAVVNFDDLAGDNILVPDGYGGINWGGQWTYYGFEQSPYTPHSPPNRVYDFVAEGQFSFVTPDQIFNGAWFAGVSSTTVQFRLYNDGILVATSAILTTSLTPTFLDAGYSGAVDMVGVFSNAPDFFIMDDVTYGGASGVPEPGSALLLGTGLLAGCALALRCRRVR